MRPRFYLPPISAPSPGSGLRLLLWAAVATLLPPGAGADDAAGGDRGIRIAAPATAPRLAPPMPHSQPLRFALETLRPSVAVGEPIHLRIRGNRAAYLYLYNIDKARGEAILLFPNRRQKDNHYRPGRDLVLPAPGVEFVSDAAGTEHLVLVATARPMTIDASAYRSLGPWTATSRRGLESALASRGIAVGGPPRPAAREVAVRELDLTVRPGARGLAHRAPSRRGSPP